MSKCLYHPETGVPGVDVATKADEDEIFGLLTMMHAEIGFFSMNPTKVRHGIRWATERRGGIIFVIRLDKRIVATLGLLIVTDWYSDDEYLLERWNFVHPDYRKSDCARKLIEQTKWTSDWFTRSALSNGRPPMAVQIGINSFQRTAGKIRLYARHMPCFGAYFMYGLIPRQNEQMQEAARQIETMNEKAHRDRSRQVVPVVETILRVGHSEDDHVRH